MSKKSDKKKDIGEILLGFAVLMYGMESMSGAVEPLADVPEFTNILTMFHNPFLGVLAGAVLTAIIQSSSASVGILQALSVTGAFTYGSVIPIIMGPVSYTHLAVISDNKYIPVDDGAAAFESNGASGKVVVAGSSSVTPVMEKLKEAYVAVNSGAEIEIQESDSTTGMTAAMDGTCDIGMASRELKDSETEGGLTAAVIAMDGLSLIHIYCYCPVFRVI